MKRFGFGLILGLVLGMTTNVSAVIQGFTAEQTTVLIEIAEKIIAERAYENKVKELDTLRQKFPQSTAKEVQIMRTDPNVVSLEDEAIKLKATVDAMVVKP